MRCCRHPGIVVSHALKSTGAAMALGLLSTGASAACVLFEHAGFQGRTFEIKSNQALEALAEMDDKASSIRVGGACILIAYDQPGFKGPSRTWGPGDYASLPAGWNDVISSARCNCRPETR